MDYGKRFLVDRMLDEDTETDTESIQWFKEFGTTYCTSRTECLRGRMRSVFMNEDSGNTCTK
uniref:Uncharacterized protein n=1 Tax=Arion vulgaris TaxID=1028688 RepID=A0A0B7B7K4_9EUPU